MSKLLLYSTILVASVFAHSETYASSPATVTCATCRTDTDFWIYGAGYIESNHGGAFAAFTSNDRVIVQNLDNVKYMIDVDSVMSTACFIYCISYDQRGKWKITFQNLNGSPAKIVETFLHVLRENFEKLQKKEAQALEEAKKKAAYDLRRGGAIDNALLAAEAYASGMGPVLQQYNKQAWEAIYWSATINRIYIGSPLIGSVPIVTQTEYSPGTYVPVPERFIDVNENYYTYY